MASDPYDTPAMRQYTRFKRAHPDCVLFFRMGDFYEMFGDDAVELSKALGLTLTQRTAGLPMAGVPYHQKDTYLRRAIDQGFRVAVCDQVQDPSEARGVVDRAVTQVVTPGTLVEDSLLEGESVSELAALSFESDDHVAVAIVDVSTGSFIVADGHPDQIVDELARRAVRELLYLETATGEVPDRASRVLESLSIQGTGRPGWHFSREEAISIIEEQFGVSGVEGFGLRPDDVALPAIGAVLRYLHETQAIGGDRRGPESADDVQRQRRTLKHLRAPRREVHERRCTLDAVSLRALEVEKTLRDGAIPGSLLGVFLMPSDGSRAVVSTPMGKRLLRDWLCAPLADATQIRARQDVVGAFVADDRAAEELAGPLGQIQDVSRIAGRIALGRATPRDLVGLGTSLQRMDDLLECTRHVPALEDRRERLRDLGQQLNPIGQMIARNCVEEPPSHLRDGGLIRDGVDEQLDEARSLQRDAGDWLAQYQGRLSAEHDLPGLKAGFNKVFGYYIELPRAQAERAPVEFIRKQTLKNAERYITPELKEFENRALTAESTAVERERILFDSMLDDTRDVVPAIGAFADVVAELDVLAGLAAKARRHDWIRPEIEEEQVAEIHAGRHPVLQELMPDRFVPNDVELGGGAGPSMALITGPNMAGKSTFIRQTALLVLLASVGSFIPADRARIGVTDRIFTRVGADDAIHRGQSTFMVEMIETANILNNATSRSLVILDEIGRGTSTLDGLSLAWAIAEELASGEQRPRSLFATHYHELTELEQRLPGSVTNLHVAVREWTDADGRQEIIFLHQIVPGRTDQSYGIHVARLAGVPHGVTTRAHEILGSLSVQEAERAPAAPSGVNEPPSQLGLFTEYVAHPALDQLREVKLDGMSPLEAFDELRRLQSEAQR